MKRSQIKRNPAATKAFIERGRGQLKADPEKVAAFRQRGRSSSAESFRKGRQEQAFDASRAEPAKKAPAMKRSTKRRKLIPRDVEVRVERLTGLTREQQLQEGPLTPARWHERVGDRCGHRSAATGATERYEGQFDRHHPLSQRWLRDHGLHWLLWHPWNGVLVEHDEHLDQENAHARLDGDRLPPSVWRFTAMVDRLLGTQAATLHVQRLHPAGGRRPSRPRRTA